MSAALLMLFCHEQPVFNIWFIVIDSVRSRVTAHLISHYLFIYLFVRVRVPHHTSMVHPSVKFTMEGTNYSSLPIKYYFIMCAEPSLSKAANLHKQHANGWTKRRTDKLWMKLNINVLWSKSVFAGVIVEEEGWSVVPGIRPAFRP